MSATYYEILGVSETASDAEIIKAFREIIKQQHPDQHQGENSHLAQIVIEAYNVLTDPKKREIYNQSLHSRNTAHLQNTERDRVTIGICSNCQGSGTQTEKLLRYIPISSVCKICNGQGKVRKLPSGRKWCSYCNGQGQVRTTAGFITMMENCSACLGTYMEPVMKEQCDKCDGFGYCRNSPSSSTCMYCNGRGWRPGKIFNA